MKKSEKEKKLKELKTELVKAKVKGKGTKEIKKAIARILTLNKE